VNWFFPSPQAPKDLLQSRLMRLAALFFFLACLVLTFSPAVRLHTWLANYRWQQWVGFAVWLLGFSLLYRQVNHFLPDRDPYLLPIIALLTGWGLLEIFRLDVNLGFRQTAWLVACFIMLLVGIRFPQLLNLLRRYKYIWLVGGLILALLTFFFGTYPGGDGPHLWLGIYGVYIQPSEFLKILLIIYLAAYLADSLPARFKLIQLITPTLILVGAALLILAAQRDLGTATLFILIYTLIVYLASGKRRVLLISFLTLVIALIAGYLLFDVIKLRVDAWLNPWLDPSGRSYQIVQSILAVANGGLFGRGPGLGSPGTVPVAQSDFIFAAISEEFGLAGGIALVGILAFFTIRGLDIALHAPNRFQRFLAAGVTTYIITQALLIIGGTIRLLPLTGVTLPFMSYGGSSLVTAYFSGFLLLIISNQAEDQPAALENGNSYVFIGTIYLVGFLFVGLAIGWWSMIRADALLSRTDNMRRSISDVYVLRGDILDRNNTIIARSSGTAGDYQRELIYPALSATVGYSNSNYGQTGIEASMDGYLRGVAGNDTSSIWLARELYGQYPQGLNIRLSIDLTLQEKADALLQGKTGGLVVMNAKSGEVLAIANSPTFDANQLDDKWQTWIADTSAPLLNRVTLGQYPVGTATGAFLLANYLQDHDLPSYDPSTNWTTSTGQNNSCAVDPGENPTWQKLIQSGCPFVLQSFFQQSTPLDLMSFYESIGITGKATTQVESVDSWTYSAVDSLQEFFTSDNIRVSPLQMAIAAAEITNGGQKVSPSFVTAYQTAQGDWRYISTQTSNDDIEAFSSPEATNLLTQPDSPNWQVVSSVKDQDKWVSWFVGGTPANWQGVPLAIVVVLEDSSPTQTAEIGQTLFNDLFSQ